MSKVLTTGSCTGSRVEDDSNYLAVCDLGDRYGWTLQEIQREIHDGVCGHHAGSLILVAKAFRHGFYWLTALADTEDLVKRCDACQKFSR